ncbi:MAG: o-succinylbenzoate synthase [bacterium]|nr:o-succinylbenzoate synthase [bacterium]
MRQPDFGGWRRGRILQAALPLVRPLATAHGPIERRNALVVALEDEDGRVGWGEATPLPEFGTESFESCRKRLVALLDGTAPASDVTKPCADFAWSTATRDLEARQVGESFAERLGRDAGFGDGPLPSVSSQALVGGETPEAVVESARALVARGFQAFKLKLAVSPGARRLGVDLDRVAALRQVIGPSARLRLDANEAWSETEARRALVALACFDVDYVEQPVARTDLEALARLAAEADIAIAADEALLGAGWRRVLEARPVSIWIAKPAALGSLDAALELVRAVGEQGGRLVWSTLIDGAIGRAAARALAGATGAPDEIHGLGTGPLLAADLCDASDPVTEGRLPTPTGPGLGLTPDGPVFDAAKLVHEVTR